SPTSGVWPTESVSDSKRMSPAGDGRQHGDRVAVGDGGVEAAEEAHVLVVEVDVDKPAQAVVVHEAVLDAGVARLQVGDQLVERRALGGHGLGAAGVVTQDGRNANLDGHRCHSPRNGRRPHRHATPAGSKGFLLGSWSATTVVQEDSRSVREEVALHRPAHHGMNLTSSSVTTPSRIRYERNSMSFSSLVETRT